MMKTVKTSETSMNSTTGVLKVVVRVSPDEVNEKSGITSKSSLEIMKTRDTLLYRYLVSLKA